MLRKLCPGAGEDVGRSLHQQCSRSSVQAGLFCTERCLERSSSCYVEIINTKHDEKLCG